jgi:hypothetical protein
LKIAPGAGWDAQGTALVRWLRDPRRRDRVRRGRAGERLLGDILSNIGALVREGKVRGTR